MGKITTVLRLGHTIGGLHHGVQTKMFVKSEEHMSIIQELKIIEDIFLHTENFEDRGNKCKIIRTKLEEKYIEGWLTNKLDRPDQIELIAHLNAWYAQIELHLDKFPDYNINFEGSLNYKTLIKGVDGYFSEDFIEKLSEVTINDLNEASKCLLNNIPTASAMISLRATEECVRKYYQYITKNDPKRKNWGEIINELLKKNKENGYKYIDNINVRLIHHLDYIRDAKRNAVNHPEKIYTISEAEEEYLSAINTIKAIYQSINKKKE